MANLFKIRELPIILFCLIVIIIFSVISQNFFTFKNFSLLFSQVTVLGLISIGMLMVILLGGIDLSVGSVLAVSATVVGTLVNSGFNPITAAIISILLGGVLGAFNGFFITRFKIPDIIVTLATMFIYRGVAVGISKGDWVTNFPDSFNIFARGKVLGIPLQLLIFLIALCIFGYILKHSSFGRRIYAMGGNYNASKLSGIPVKKTKFTLYLLSGMLTSIAGVIYASEVGSVQAATAGKDIAFLVIAAVLVGGASIFGGVGTVLGTFFGVLLMGIIENGLILIQASVYWIDATTGFILIMAIIMNTVQRSRDSMSRERELV